MIPANTNPVATILRPLLLLIASMLVFSACETPREDAQGTTGTIAGTAYLSTKDPQTGNAGILVYLGGTSHQVRTDMSGNYRMDQVPAGTYTMIAERAGFQSVSLQDLVVDPARHTANNPLVPSTATLEKLPETTGGAVASQTVQGTILGTVLLEDSPWDNGGVRIEVTDQPYTAVSASDGRFRILNVEPGEYTLTYLKDGYEPYVSDYTDITSGTTIVTDVALRVDQSGNGGVGTTSTVATSPSAPVINDIQRSDLVGNRTISGIVQAFDESNQPITDVNRLLVAINGSDIVATVGANGQFRFENLPPGNYNVIARLDEEEPVLTPADVTQADLTNLEIQLQQEFNDIAGTLTGQVILLDGKGNPEPENAGVQVAVNGTNMMMVTDATGSFRFADLPVGTYAITATKSGFLEAVLRDIVVAEGESVADDILMEPDIDFPRVVSTTPANGTENVTVGLEIPVVIRFNKKMNPDTVRNAVSITPSASVLIEFGRGSHPQADDDKLVILFSNASADNPIIFDQEYTINIADSASDLDGNEMKEPFSMSFETGAPGVIATSPPDGATGVYVDQLEYPVTIFFNTQLDPESINPRNFRVRPDNGTSVRTRFLNDPRTGWTNVSLYHNWQMGTDYTVTVQREVRSQTRQRLGNTPFQLRFGTGDLEVIQVPISNPQ